MPKHSKNYTLFIASPGDINKEKEIIRKLAEQWNRMEGRKVGLRIEVNDWSEAYPEWNKRPQSVINEQIFDEADFVVALFWTKFGSPTGIADSGTEEEILRAAEQQKPLMLYFSDAQQNPSLIDPTEYEKIKKFRQKHQDSGLYKIYDSHHDFEEKFRENLSAMMHRLRLEPVDQTEAGSAIKDIADTANTEHDETGAQYKPYREIENNLQVNFPTYWTKIYGVIESKSVLPGGIMISSASNNKEEIKKLKEKVKEWEKRIEDYTRVFRTQFDDVDKYEDDEFKNEIVANDLWTVHGALKNHDAELRQYQYSFKRIEAFKVKETVRNIIAAANEFVATKNITSPSVTGMDVLGKTQTLLTFVIGKGIRSEILHKINPQYFPLMTRRSIWGLFFLSGENSEFVVDQTKDGSHRTIHNWDYLYDYFTFYNHLIFRLLKDYFLKHKITLKEELKYGYVNLFLVDIYQSHSREIEQHRRFKNLGL